MLQVYHQKGTVLIAVSWTQADGEATILNVAGHCVLEGQERILKTSCMSYYVL